MISREKGKIFFISYINRSRLWNEFSLFGAFSLICEMLTSAVSLFFSSNGKVTTNDSFSTIKIYDQKLTTIRYGYLGNQLLVYWHLVFKGEEWCFQKMRCSALGLLPSCRCLTQIHWVSKELFSSNRQNCSIRPCHALDEISLKDVNLLLVSFPVFFLGYLRYE